MDTGVVFELSPGGKWWTETVLHTFTGGTDGAYPTEGPVMDSAGNLYGKTLQTSTRSGIVYELTRFRGGWAEQTIYSLGSSVNYSFENNPGLTIDSAGNIFGSESYGKYDGSKIFELSPDGNGGWDSTVIFTFDDTATNTLVVGNDGNLYGTTVNGSRKHDGTVFELRLGKNGEWAKKSLYAFQGGDDGEIPQAGITLDSAGNIYGTTGYGGASTVCGVTTLGVRCGTVFELTAPIGNGTYQEKILWSFDLTDGAEPTAGLFLDSESNLYGTAEFGGANYAGVAFEVIQ
jgi:hypothetical protein